MSKFFVGQRVRKVRGPQGGFHIPNGTEGVVTSIGPIRKGERCHDGLGASQDADCTVSYSGDDRLAYFWNIEPITPSGAQPSEYTTLHDLLTSLEGVAA